jgi:serine protease
MKSKHSLLALLLVASLSLVAVPAPAATIHVPADQPTIQQAINAATNGDTVLVSPGTYLEHIDYHGKAITIRSTGGPVQTIIDGTNTGLVVEFQSQEGAQSILTGFTIRRGGLDMFGASPTITQNIFRDNTDAFESATALQGNISSAVIEQNTFFANTSGTQFSDGVVVFVNDSSPHIINNVFRNNLGRALNIDLPSGNHPVIANNTIVQNNVGVLTNGRFSSTNLYANNIVVGNVVGFEVDDIAGNLPQWTNNLVFGNTTNYSGIANQTGLNGNISSDPMFLSTRSRNTFQLQLGSPAIDAGTLSVPSLPPTDFLGNPRVVDGDGNGSVLPDIGAYEFIPHVSGFEDQGDLLETTDEITSEAKIAPK